MNLKDNVYDLKCRLWENKKNLILIAGSIELLVLLIASQIHVIFIKTNSIPYFVGLQVYREKPKKHDLCAFKFKGQKFVKYIIGIEGDRIMNLADAIYVDGFRVGKADRTDILTPIESGKVPKGYVFVAGRHPKSLDSRYKEFGFIKVSDLKGKVYGFIKDSLMEDTFINWYD